MKKIVVLDAKAIGEFDVKLLEKFGEVKVYQTTDKSETKERIADAHIILTNKVYIGKEEMDTCKNLEIICETATGFNNIDVKYAKEKSIAVTNVAGYSTPTVVQHTFATLFALNNQIEFYDNYVKSGEYSKSGFFTNLDRPFMDVAGKKWGIIGLGAIGRSVAKVCEAFGIEVVYYSTSGRNNSNDYKRVDLDVLLKECDIISIHAPLNEKTEGLMNYENLKKMKKSGIIINMGRGPIIVEADLARALNEDIIKGAALDVFAVEPMPIDSPLLKIENKEKIIMTPHIAWASIEARERLFNLIIENIEAFYKGEIKNRVEL
ncbi:D-2-hydroxyacid dehydrogenase [uncultured Clostridium sp.]|uniref:D-2-hydroxyacid dehydrogenase n=1 Tax=uncultured Clostridium sp. TaxID=59620 RepID=UPI00261BA8E1|nr:D-2-hydroxyacid dehydrogenase [uncultured Clostridium sp.]